MSDFIEIIPQSAIDRLVSANAEIVKMISNVDVLNKKQGGVKTPSQSDDAIKQLTAAYNEQEKTIAKLQKQLESLARSRTVNAKLTTQEKIDNAILQRAANEQAKSISILTTEYDKASITLERLRKEAKAIGYEFGEDSKIFQIAAANVRVLDERIKAIDRSLGLNQRNVGNYVGGYNGLSASISQIARELPSAAYGFQTFAVAIGNNVPMAVDNIQRVIAENKELIAQGKPVVSVWKQIGDAIFSFNTYMTIGLLVLALYGKEIGEWAKSLFGANAELEKLNENQKKFNKSRLEGAKEAIAPIDELNKYLRIAKDVTASDDERAVAIERIRSAYVGYSKNITDQQFLDGNTAKFNKDVVKALNDRADAEQKVKLVQDNKKTIKDLEYELGLNDTLLKKSKERQSQLEKSINNALGSEERSALNSLLVSENRKVTDLTTRRSVIEKSITAINKQNLKYTEQIYKLQKDSILLEDSKDSKDKKSNVLTDYIKTLNEFDQAAYELGKFRREREIQLLEQLSADEKRSFADRITTYGEMLQKKQELLSYNLKYEQMQLDEAQRVEIYQADARYKQEVEEASGNAQQLIKIRKYHNDEIALINRQYNSRELLLKAKYDASYLDVVDQTSKSELDIIKKRREIVASTEKTYRDEQSSIFKKNSDNEKLSLAIRQQSFESYIALKRKELDIEKVIALAKAGNNEEEIKQIKARFEVANRLLNTEFKEQSPFAKSLEYANGQLKELSNNIQNSFLGSAGLSSLSTLLDGTFSKVTDGFDQMASEVAKRGGTLEEILAAQSDATRKKMAYTFLTVSEIAKETFALISNLSQENFDAAYERLEKEKNVAILFAGESAAAKEQVERDYDEKRKQLQRREAQAAKEIAVFNVIINTAQAIISALATAKNIYAGIALSIFAAAVGATQLAAINAAQPPSFFKGTDNAPGGYAWVDERGPEIHTDKHGNIKSTGSKKGANLRMLEKGDKILTHEKSKALMFDNGLNSILSNNGISASPNITLNNDNTQLLSALNGVKNSIDSKPVGGMEISDGEMKSYIIVNNKKLYKANCAARNIRQVFI